MNDIPIIGKNGAAPPTPMSEQAKKSPFFGAAHTALGVSMAKCGATGQAVITMFPDGSYTVHVQGQYAVPALLHGHAMLGQFAAKVAGDMIMQQDLALRANMAASKLIPG